MFRFVTVRCSCCGTVMYNLPAYEIEKLENSNLICEDCIDHSTMEIFNIINELECSVNNRINSQSKTYTCSNLVLYQGVSK